MITLSVATSSSNFSNYALILMCFYKVSLVSVNSKAYKPNQVTFSFLPVSPVMNLTIYQHLLEIESTVKNLKVNFL